MNEQDPTNSGERSSTNYADYLPPKKSRPIWLKWLVIVLVVVLVIAIAYAGFKVTSKKKPAAASTASTQQLNQTPAKPISTQTKNYASQNFALSFDYPQDWTVTDTTGSGVMTVRSPKLSLLAASGQKTDGQIVLTFRNKTQKLTEFNAGAALAVIDSDKIAYTKPTQSQRGNTYVSFLQYAKTTATGALDGVYITGDAGYQKGQNVPLVDMTKVDPVVSLTFVKCADSSCGNVSPLSLASTSWNDSNFSGPLLAILKSLSIN